MSIQTECAGCSTKINAPDKYAGRSAKCPKCQAHVRFPMAEAATKVGAAAVAAAVQQNAAFQEPARVAPHTVPRWENAAPLPPIAPHAPIEGANGHSGVSHSPRLKECEDCGHLVSRKAIVCMRCGSPQSAEFLDRAFVSLSPSVVGVIVIAIGMVLFVACFRQEAPAIIVVPELTACLVLMVFGAIPARARLKLRPRSIWQSLGPHRTKPSDFWRRDGDR
jgi:uncharacterized paraquat-inducible protein A